MIYLFVAVNLPRFAAVCNFDLRNKTMRNSQLYFGFERMSFLFVSVKFVYSHLNLFYIFNNFTLQISQVSTEQSLDSVNSSPSTSLLTPSIYHKEESNKMDLKK